jgi:ADP-ribosylglycohydrolase
MRMAPAGLFTSLEPEESFQLGCQLAAITHGNPSGYLAAGAFAMIVRLLLDGSWLLSAVDQATNRVRQEDRSHECVAALENAVATWRRGAESPVAFSDHIRNIEALGKGWVAEEALAIGIYAALTFQSSFDEGVRLAVNHGGDSDSTGSIAGNLLGTLLGEEALPGKLLADLELSGVIAQVADDIVDADLGRGEWMERYPVT